MHASALFIVPYPSDVGFAIDQLVGAFFNAFCALNNGDTSRAHFAFTSLDRGASKALPEGFVNVVAFEHDASRDLHARLALGQYLQQHGIRLVVLLDEQPVSRFVAFLRQYGVECVVSYWGAPISDPSYGLRLLLKRIGLTLAGRRRVDSLIFESQAMAQLATTGRGCERSMIDVVPTGTDSERFTVANDKSYVHEQFGVGRNRLIIVFAGHVHERKGIGTLMDAATILMHDRGRDDLFFLICGDRDNEAAPYVRRLQAAGIESGVLFAGYRPDIAMILSHSDVGVVPSSGWDSFPMSALDMAAAGLPVIGSRLGGIPETLVDGETGLLFNTGDAVDLADKIQYFAEHAAARRAFGERGRARVERGFTRAVQSRRLQQVLEERLRAAVT